MTWKHSEIRQARQTPLRPILENLGYELQHLRNGNYLLRRLATETCRGVPDGRSQIVVKDHYWVSNDDGSAGNAIDFLVEVEGLSFNQAMNMLISTANQPATSPEQ